MYIIILLLAPDQKTRAYDDSPCASPGSREFNRTMRNMPNVRGITVANSPSQYNRIVSFAQKEGCTSSAASSPAHMPMRESPSRMKEIKADQIEGPSDDEFVSPREAEKKVIVVQPVPEDKMNPDEEDGPVNKHGKENFAHNSSVPDYEDPPKSQRENAPTIQIPPVQQ